MIKLQKRNVKQSLKLRTQQRELEAMRISEEKAINLEEVNFDLVYNWEKLNLKILKIEAIKNEKSRVLSARLAQKDIMTSRKLAAIKEEERHKTENFFHEIKNEDLVREENWRRKQLYLTQQRLQTSKEREIKRKAAYEKSVKLIQEQEKKTQEIAEKNRCFIEQKYKTSQNAILNKQNQKKEFAKIQKLIFEKKKLGIIENLEKMKSESLIVISVTILIQKSIEKEKKAEEKMKRFEEYKRIEKEHRREQREAKSQEIKLSIVSLSIIFSMFKERKEQEEFERKTRKINLIEKAHIKKEQIIKDLETQRKNKVKEEEKKEYQVRLVLFVLLV